ncbi:MAG: helix-turn-helix transcriptional regulator [Bacteroidales bacterium]|nr:helix-turn-helix transcriptional regulator [Bacteroidales bacterium]MCM1147455.1 helix-turn-helix transcriptional regulator [Bacteroidales bacterium]MCM1206124.1 helix-turn-helix transcriptional regulator [Bacillota bacterium]MCM1510045.1 helix-turn-helix transcriptional regulator [Clostridium sp.]
MKKSLDYNYCKAAPIIEWMSHKWTLVILLRMEAFGKMAYTHENDKSISGIRFGDLFREIPHISEKMLATTLDYLEAEGLITRNVKDIFPPHTEYSLTPLAASFLKEISYVIEWGHIHFDEIKVARNKSKINDMDAAGVKKIQ